MARSGHEPPAAAPPSRALREFFATETASGVLLVAATVVALVWVNSPWDAGYRTLWETVVGIRIGRFGLELDLHHWVNDGLMALFFLVVALEVKRELLLGELRDRRTAALPVVAAIGGMAVPALVFVALNPTGDAARGWGIPMATDIAFALAVLALVARSLPPTVRLFLLTLAIVDDIGAIVVIAVFYSDGIDGAWLAAAVAVLAVVALLRRFGLDAAPLFVPLGVALWVALHASGIHATLAGVAMGLMVPVARIEGLEHRLHPWTSLVIVPVFALSNAGIPLDAGALGDAATSPITIGVLLGLVAGKTIGISGAAWLAVRAGIADLPRGVGWRALTGAAALGGIGFTVSLFITELAFEGTPLADEAKVGIVAAALAAIALGALLLRGGTGADGADPTPPR